METNDDFFQRRKVLMTGCRQVRWLVSTATYLSMFGPSPDVDKKLAGFVT